MRKILLTLTALLGMVLSANIALAAVSQWSPVGGESDVQKEYTYQRMYWADTSGFGSIGTYEHETIVYNPGFANPASGGYWASNLPRAYKDTQFRDSTENFTVGSAAASSISRHTWYYTYYDLSPQDASAPQPPMSALTGSVVIVIHPGATPPGACGVTKVGAW